MNKNEYLNELRKYLKRVPKYELEDAIEYYTEYFDEAGVENEKRVIEELGSPKDLAKKIIVECVDKNFSEDYEENNQETKKEKKGLSPWLILLAVFALPLSPIAFVLVIVALALIFAVVVTFIALLIGFGATVLAGIVSVVAGFVALFISPSGGLLMIGVGLVATALGAILFGLVFTLFDLLIKSSTKAGGKMVHEKAEVKK